MDTLADPRYIESHPDIRSEVAVPLIVQDRVVGVMDLESERIGYFTEDHTRLLACAALRGHHALDCDDETPIKRIFFTSRLGSSPWGGVVGAHRCLQVD